MTVAVETLLTVVNTPVQDGVYNYTVDSWDPAHIRVRLTGGAGGDVTLTQGPDFTVAPGGRASARTITLLADPDGATQMLIDRQTTVAQESAFVATAAGFEAALDRLAMSVQERLGEYLDSVLGPIGVQGLRIPEPGAGLAIGWNAAGDALATMAPGTAVEVGVNGAITQGAGGTGATTLGAGLVAAAGGTLARALSAHAGKWLGSADNPVATLPAAAYVQGAGMIVGSGETVTLACDPTGGDDIQDMADYLSARHYVSGSGRLSMVLAAGTHALDTYIDVIDGRQLLIDGPASPTLLQIVASISVANVSGNTYVATIRTDADIPASVVAGSLIGVQYPQGLGMDASSVAGVHKVVGVAGDRRSLTVNYLSYGETPTSAGTLDNATQLLGSSFLPNKLVIPSAQLVVADTGWDGGAREGFINALSRGRISMKHFAIEFNGAGATEHDLVFAGGGGVVECADYMLLYGAGDKVARAGQRGELKFNRSFVGGLVQAEALQALMGDVEGTRTTFSGGLTSGFTAGRSSLCYMTQCIFVGSPILARTTGAGAQIGLDNSLLRHGTVGARVAAGQISLNDDSSIEECTTPLEIASSDFLKIIDGDPTIQNNTNTVIQHGVWTNGGFWTKDGSTPQPETWNVIGRTTAVVNFGSIAGGAYEESAELSMPGLDTSDIIIVSPDGVFPASNISFNGHYSSAGMFRIRCTNHNDDAAETVDPASDTYVCVAIRTA